MNEFILGFGDRLNGKIPSEQLSVILRELEIYCSGYDITAKETALSTHLQELPEEFRMFMVAKKIAGLSEGTLKQYGLHLVPFFYALGKEVKDITDNDVTVYLYSLQRNNPKLSNRSLDGVRRILCSFFGWCHKVGHIVKNPMLSIPAIKFEKKEIRPINDEDFEQIRQSFTNVRDAAIFEVLYSTGCRVSELVGIDISDIDFHTKEVKLFGKGKKHRTAFLSVRATVAVKKYLATRPANASPALFVGLRYPYNRLTTRTVQSMLTKHKEAIGFAGELHPHLLRHQFATDWVEKGLPVTELQQILGHEELSVTQIYYTMSKNKAKSNHQRFIA